MIQGAGVARADAGQGIDQAQDVAGAFRHDDGHLVGDGLANRQIRCCRVLIGCANAGEGRAFRRADNILVELRQEHQHCCRVAAIASTPGAIRQAVGRL